MIGNNQLIEVSLKEVNKSNWKSCTLLEVTDEQKEVFPFPVVNWIAESKFETSFNLVSIYLGQDLIGFSVYGQDPEDGGYWIIAFMIDKHYQRKGYGRKAMTKMIEFVSERHKCRSITIVHRPSNHIAESLYSSLGFRELTRTKSEVVRRLAL